MSQPDPLISSGSPMKKAIVLVLVHNLNDKSIECDYFKSMFSPYGVVKKVLIFEKNVPTKAFVELAAEEEVKQSIAALNNTFTSDGGKINVYVSELLELKLPQKNYRYARDYTVPLTESDSPPLKSAPLIKNTSPHTKTSPLSKNAASLFMIPEINELTPMSHEDVKNIEERAPPGLEKSFKNFQLQKGIFLEKVNPNAFGDFKPTKSAYLEHSKTPSTNDSRMNLLEALSAGIVQKIAGGSASSLWEESSRVLYVKGLNNKQISVRHVYNLFSNFGDIKRIIMLRMKEVALIEFETLEFAKLAKDNLNNLFFFDDYLKISFSNYKEIIPKNISKNTMKEDLMICEKSHNRFKNNEKSLNINPPGSVLHLSNLDRNSCKDETIIGFFKDVCEVDSLK